MQETYELYIPQADGSRLFLALTCPAGELAREVQRVLAGASATSCEVHQFGRRLFTMELGASSMASEP
jgi:hypothetical protein